MKSILRLLLCGSAVLLSTLTGRAEDQVPTVEQIDGLIWQDQFDEAKNAIVALEAASPDSPDILYAEARLASAQNEPVSALEKIDAALEAAPDNAQYHAARGTILVGLAQTQSFAQQGRSFMQSLEAYKKAVKLDGDNFEAHFGLAQYYLNAPEFAGGSLVLAEKHATEAARLNPEMGAPLLERIQGKKEEGEGK